MLPAFPRHGNSHFQLEMGFSQDFPLGMVPHSRFSRLDPSALIPWICLSGSSSSRIPLLSRCWEFAGKGNFSPVFLWNVLSIPAFFLLVFPPFIPWDAPIIIPGLWKRGNSRKRNIPAQYLLALIPLDPSQLRPFQDFLTSGLCRLGFEGYPCLGISWESAESRSLWISPIPRDPPCIPNILEFAP